MIERAIKEKIRRVLSLAVMGTLLVATKSATADAVGKKPAMLILPNVIQKDSPVYSSPRRGTSLPDKKLMDYIRKEKGFALEVGAFSPKLDMAFLKQFNLVVIGTGGEGSQSALENELSGEKGRLLLEYVKAGGGLLVMRNPGWQFGNDISEYNEWLAGAGIKILNEQVTDTENQTVTVSNAKVFWTDNIARHPVTEGVEGFYYPNVYNLGYARYTDFTSPVKADGNWQILIRGRETASSYERKKAGTLQPENPGSYDKSPPLLAVRDYGKGRIAVMPVASSPYWHDCYHVFWDRGFMMDGTRQNMKGGGLALMKNLFDWLAAPSIGTMGGYAPPPKKEKQAEAGFQRIDWDRIEYRSILMDRNFIGLIGAMSNLSSGQDTPEAMIAAAREAGYDFIAFAEELGKTNEEKFNRLIKICANASDEKFKAFQGLKYIDDSGNAWVVFSDTLTWPREAWFGKDSGRLSVNNPMARGWGWPPMILLHPNRNPEKPWEQGNFKPISVYTYEDGRLVDEAVNHYLRLLNNSFRAYPVAVHLVRNAEAVRAARNHGFQTMTRWFDGNLIEAFKGLSPRHDGRPVHTRPVYISEGPVIEDFRIINFGMSDLAIPGNDRCRLLMKTSSSQGLAEVRITDSIDPEPWRRFLPRGEKELMTSIDFYHDQQRSLAMFVTDTEGRRAIGSEACTIVQENSFIRCSDNFNTMPRGKWWGQPEHLQNIRGFEDYLAVRNFTWCGIPRFGGIDPEGARPSVEYHPVLASRFGSIVDTLISRHHPMTASGNLDQTDQQATSSENEYYNALVRYVFFTSRQTSTLARIIEGEIDILKDFEGTAPLIYSEQGRKGSDVFCGTADYHRFVSGKFAEKKKSYSLRLPGKGYAALYPDVFRGSLGLVALDGEINVYAYTHDMVHKNIHARLGAGQRRFAAGDKLAYRYISLKSVLDPVPDNSFVNDIVYNMGIEGEPACKVKPRKGSVVGHEYVLRLEADEHVFDGIFSRAELPLNLPVMVSGLNPNWDAGILYRGRNRLLIQEWVVDEYNERFIRMVPRDYENELYRIPVMSDGTGFLQVDTELGDRDVFIGNLLVCDNPRLKLVVTDIRKGREAFTAHNPTDNDITTTVKPADGFGLLGDFAKTITVPKGSTIEVTLGAGIQESKVTIAPDAWRLPRNCSLVQEGKDGGTCVKVTGDTGFYSSMDFPVDPAKTYRLTGSFRSVGEAEGRVYLGLYPLDKEKRYIAPNTVNCLPGTETELVAACSPDDTVIRVKDGSRWRTITHAVVAFDIDDSGGFADLPNRNVSTPGVEKVERKDNHWEIVLSKPCGKEYSAGTKVRQHPSGNSFIYCSAENQAVPKAWTAFSGTVGGVKKGSLSNSQFRPGTAYVRVGIMANYRGNQDNIMLIDNVSLEQVD